MARVLTREYGFEHVGKEHVFAYGHSFGVYFGNGAVAHEWFIVVEFYVVQSYAAAGCADKCDAELQVARAAGQRQRYAGLLTLRRRHFVRH